jgi:hypothetical protein
VYNVLIDNGDAGFSTTGDWRESVGDGFWGTPSVFSDQAGATATWRPYLNRPGFYDIFVRWTWARSRGDAAQYTVNHAGGSQTFTVDQSGGQDTKWVRLGQFRFNTGDDGSVALRSSGDGSTGADAVLFRLYVDPNNQPPTADFAAENALGQAPLTTSFDASGSTDDDDMVEECQWDFGDGRMGSGVDINHTYASPGDYVVTLTAIDDGFGIDTHSTVVGVTSPDWDTTIILDNRSPGFSTSGEWTESSAEREYAGSSLYAMAGGETATWTPNFPQRGRYMVFAWWTYSGNRARHAPYTITHANGVDTVRVDQRRQTGRWAFLGIYEFHAGTAMFGNVTVTREAGDGTTTNADAVKFIMVQDDSYLPLTFKTD